jgi:hypothetical protein
MFHPVSDDQGGRRFADDEVEVVLRKALERQMRRDRELPMGGLGEDELMAAAKEVGIGEADLQAAMAEVEAEREEKDVIETVRRNAKRSWRSSALSYLLVVGALLALFAQGMLGNWVFIVALLWGASLALDTFRTFSAEVPTKQIRREKLRRQRAQLRAERHAARREKRLADKARREAREASRRKAREAGKELEKALEEGVGVLLNAAAGTIRDASQKLQQKLDEPPPEPSDFERYVRKAEAEEQGTRTGVRVASESRATGDGPDPEDEMEITAGGARQRRRRAGG